MPVTRQHMMKNSSDSSLQFVAKMQREMMTATTNALTFSGTMRKRVMKVLVHWLVSVSFSIFSPLTG